jgi:type VI secretion system protein ImpK
MPGAMKLAPERRANLAMAFQELLTAVVRLRFNSHSVSNADAFRAHIREALRNAIQDGTARGYAADDVNMCVYAVVAFLDESILNSKDPVSAMWSGQSLQQELSYTHLAGEQFFVYAQQLLSRPDSAETADILEVFYLCLLLGYRGRYALADKGELGVIMRAIRDKIQRCRGNAPISPNAMLPLDPPQPKHVDPWLRPLVLASGLAALLAILIFVGCQILLHSGSSNLNSLAGR